MMDPFKQLISVAQGSLKTLADNQETILGILKSQFTAEGIEAARKGTIFLSEKDLHRELSKRIGKDGRVELKSLSCLEDRISACARGSALKASVSVEYQVKIEALRLDPESQHLRMGLLSETYGGNNFLGSCAVAMGEWLLKLLIRNHVRKSDLSRVLEFENNTSVILKFGELDVIQKLNGEILPGTGFSALQLVRCTGASHEIGGVRVKLGLGGVSGI